MEATFFSAVTASTLQYRMDEDSLGTLVMGLWISSLILSIASAINSQLAIHWQTTVHKRQRPLPIWIFVCLVQTPFLFLIGAVLAFSAGLVVWTFAANLAVAVKVTASVMTFATLLILVVVLAWEAREWWQATRSSKAVEETPSAPSESTERGPVSSLEEGGIETAPYPGLPSASVHGTNTSGRPLDKRNDAQPPLSPTVPRPQATLSRTSTNWSGNLHPDRRSELQSLCPAQSFPIDHRLDHDIHFSPDGKRLAISTPTGLIIYDVGQYEKTPAPLDMGGGGFFSFEQFTWSPDSSHIVMFNGTGVLVWNRDKLWRATKGWKKHQPPRRVKAIIALQAPSQFFVALDRETHILEADGQFRKTGIGRLPLHICDIASIPHQQEENQKQQPTRGLVLVLGHIIEDVPAWTSDSDYTRIAAKRPSSAMQEHWLM
ncbi:hypothetical protein FS837_002404, partial [Tulasnella sp. UAMH 9824]